MDQLHVGKLVASVAVRIGLHGIQGIPDGLLVWIQMQSEKRGRANKSSVIHLISNGMHQKVEAAAVAVKALKRAQVEGEPVLVKVVHAPVAHAQVWFVE